MTQQKTISLILLRSWKVMRWTQLNSDLYSKALNAFTCFRLLNSFVSYTFSSGKKKGGEQWDLGNFYLFKFHSKFECGRK